MAIYRWFSHEKWWFSIVMLVYQRLLFEKNPFLAGWDGKVCQFTAAKFGELLRRSIHTPMMIVQLLDVVEEPYFIYIYKYIIMLKSEQPQTTGLQLWFEREHLAYVSLTCYCILYTVTHVMTDCDQGFCDWFYPCHVLPILSDWRCNSVELASGGISYFHAIPHGTCVFYIDDYWFILHSWLIIIDDHWLSMIIIEDHWGSLMIIDYQW